MTSGRLILRTDADAFIGTGHVMRCLALAQAWADIGGVPMFAMSCGADLFRQRIEGEGFDIGPVNASPGSPADARETRALARDTSAAWIVVDGYHFGSAYLDQVRGSARILVIDDLGRDV